MCEPISKVKHDKTKLENISMMGEFSRASYTSQNLSHAHGLLSGSSTRGEHVTRTRVSRELVNPSSRQVQGSAVGELQGFQTERSHRCRDAGKYYCFLISRHQFHVVQRSSSPTEHNKIQFDVWHHILSCRIWRGPPGNERDEVADCLLEL